MLLKNKAGGYLGNLAALPQAAQTVGHPAGEQQRCATIERHGGRCGGGSWGRASNGRCLGLHYRGKQACESQ